MRENNILKWSNSPVCQYSRCPWPAPRTCRAGERIHLSSASPQTPGTSLLVTSWQLCSLAFTINDQFFNSTLSTYEWETHKYHKMKLKLPLSHTAHNLLISKDSLIWHPRSRAAWHRCRGKLGRKLGSGSESNERARSLSELFLVFALNINHCIYLLSVVWYLIWYRL